VGAVNTAKFNENQSYLSPRNTQKTQKKYDSESVIKDFRGISRISRATTKSERLVSSSSLERFAPVLSPEETKKSLHSSSFLYYHPFYRKNNFLSSLHLKET